jgi:hypothetical protein
MGAGASGVILWGKKGAAEAATVVFGIAPMSRSEPDWRWKQPLLGSFPLKHLTRRNF